MKYIAAAYFLIMAVTGVSNTESGRFVRFSFVAMPAAMMHIGTLQQGNAIIHWHL